MRRFAPAIAALAVVGLAGCGSGSNESLVAFERVGDGWQEIPVEDALSRQGRTVPTGASQRDAVETGQI